jgi:hypothetical protein
MRTPYSFRLAVALIVLVAPLTALAQEAGRATSVTGVVSVQRASGSMGIVARGSAVQPGDTLYSQPDSRAIIELRDGAKLTVRPGTELKIEGYRYAADGSGANDSTILRLLKGGFRTITGLLGQRRPSAFQVNTGTATIGIRGTDFVTRICEADCAAESKGVATRIARTPGYVARLLAVQGTLTTATGPRAGKGLATGDPVYADDILSTGKGSFGVLVFQDGTRIVLQENTRFAVERYQYEPSRPEKGNVVFRLLTGGLRAVTGFIARSNNKQFQVNTAVATIGVRGTGFDVLCTDACSDTGAPTEADAPGGLSLANWQGCNVVTNEQGEATACEGQALNVASSSAAPQPLDKVPAYFERNAAPRPDKLKVDLDDLFGLQQETFAEAGAYVQVREGTVTLKGASTELFTLAKGETGYVDPSGQKFIRLGVTPVFLDRDVFTRDGEPDDYGCFVK